MSFKFFDSYNFKIVIKIRRNKEKKKKKKRRSEEKRSTFILIYLKPSWCIGF
jgi:hypothetical protein